MELGQLRWFCFILDLGDHYISKQENRCQTVSKYLGRLAALLSCVALFFSHSKATKSFGHWRRHMFVLLPFFLLLLLVFGGVFLEFLVFKSSDVNSDDVSLTSVTKSQQF